MKKVFVNGTFDILHKGHLRLLHYAKSLGDVLYVAVDSDARVKTKKGTNRPINDENSRVEFLINLKNVDYGFIFNSDEELEYLIKEIEPDIMVVGSDWEDKKVIGSEFAKELKFFDRIDGYSTTRTIQDIIDRGNLRGRLSVR
jgi:D-beta-D-heptose 7-phosphate kinase/D-beta-D-heptose 1-phosphate adenosyltransferase